MTTKMIPPEEGKVPCEVFTRIVGYVSPKRNWNVGKLQEGSERRPFDVDIAIMRTKQLEK